MAPAALSQAWLTPHLAGIGGHGSRRRCQGWGTQEGLKWPASPPKPGLPEKALQGPGQRDPNPPHLPSPPGSMTSAARHLMCCLGAPPCRTRTSSASSRGCRPSAWMSSVWPSLGAQSRRLGGHLNPRSSASLAPAKAIHPAGRRGGPHHPQRPRLPGSHGWGLVLSPSTLPTEPTLGTWPPSTSLPQPLSLELPEGGCALVPTRALASYRPCPALPCPRLGLGMWPQPWCCLNSPPGLRRAQPNVKTAISSGPTQGSGKTWGCQQHRQLLSPAGPGGQHHPSSYPLCLPAPTQLLEEEPGSTERPAQAAWHGGGAGRSCPQSLSTLQTNRAGTPSPCSTLEQTGVVPGHQLTASTTPSWGG